MKKKLCIVVGIAAFVVAIAFNINAGLKNRGEMDINLNTIESQAQSESGFSHGRPLLQSNTGTYKCGNCSGSDCGPGC